MLPYGGILQVKMQPNGCARKVNKRNMQKKRIVAAIYIFFGIVFFIYCVLRKYEYSYVNEIDTKNYLVNENACYEIENIWYGESYMGMSGYFYWYGDVERPWNCSMALMDCETGIIYEIPTQFMEREDEKEKYSPISHFGFTCRVNTKKTNLENCSYQLCFIDKGDGKTGVLTHLDAYIGKETI